MALNFGSGIWWIVAQVGEAVFVAIAFAGTFATMRKSQKETFEKRRQRHSPPSPSAKKQTQTLLRGYRWIRDKSLIASVPLWLASVDDPLGTREDVIEFLENGPKRYPRFRRRFIGLMIELYTMAAETATRDSTEGNVLKAFVQRLETVRSSQFPE